LPDDSSHIAEGLLTYRIRIMGAIVVVELVLLLLFLFWPITQHNKPQTFHIQKKDQETHLHAPVQTVQNSPPPPPSPQVPVPVPNDQPVKVTIKHYSHKLFSNATDSLSATPGKGGQGNEAIDGNPEQPPRVRRIVEPSYQNNTDNKYEITVRFLVDKKGNVQNVKIVAIYRLNKKGNRTGKVSHIDPHIKEIILKAARNWKFRPARDHGKAVRAYAKNYFTI